jgi:hypothetical protein
MPVKCSICSHPRIQEIDSLLDSGTFKKDISAQFQVSVHALSRHGRGLCRADGLDEEEEKWAARLEKTYQQASFDGDSRAAHQVAASALRHVRQRKAERTKVAASKQVAGEDDGKIYISSLDEMVGVLTQEHPSPVDCPKIAEALRRSRELSRPDFVTIFLKAYECREFAEALATFSSLWEPVPKPTQKGDADATVSQKVSSAPN